jgi:tetratricopeptide (TPR) repeat protein
MGFPRTTNHLSKDNFTAVIGNVLSFLGDEVSPAAVCRKWNTECNSLNTSQLQKLQHILIQAEFLDEPVLLIPSRPYVHPHTEFNAQLAKIAQRVSLFASQKISDFQRNLPEADAELPSWQKTRSVFDHFQIPHAEKLALLVELEQTPTEAGYLHICDHLAASNRMELVLFVASRCPWEELKNFLMTEVAIRWIQENKAQKAIQLLKKIENPYYSYQNYRNSYRNSENIGRLLAQKGYFREALESLLKIPDKNSYTYSETIERIADELIAVKEYQFAIRVLSQLPNFLELKSDNLVRALNDLFFQEQYKLLLYYFTEWGLINSKGKINKQMSHESKKLLFWFCIPLAKMTNNELSILLASLKKKSPLLYALLLPQLVKACLSQIIHSSFDPIQRDPSLTPYQKLQKITANKIQILIKAENLSNLIEDPIERAEALSQIRDKLYAAPSIDTGDLPEGRLKVMNMEHYKYKMIDGKYRIEKIDDKYNIEKLNQSLPPQSPFNKRVENGKALVKVLWETTFLFRCLSFFTLGILPLITFLVGTICISTEKNKAKQASGRLLKF